MWWHRSLACRDIPARPAGAGMLRVDGAKIIQRDEVDVIAEKCAVAS